eukprot:11305382-Alexandrium_andersonii.AAC.1
MCGRTLLAIPSHVLWPERLPGRWHTAHHTPPRSGFCLQWCPLAHPCHMPLPGPRPGQGPPQHPAWAGPQSVDAAGLEMHCRRPPAPSGAPGWPRRHALA